MATHPWETGEARYPELEGMVEFAENPEPRCPCIILVDQSTSMKGDRIASVNKGIREFKNSIMEDEVAAARAEIAIITFNHRATTVQDFTAAWDLDPPTISAGGSTNISGAVHHAISELERRKRTYRANGIESYRPIIILITDGEPTSDDPELLANVSNHIAGQEEGKHLTFFTFAVEGADLKKLAQIAPPNRPPMQLREARIEEMFLWLSNSVSAISQSQPGDSIRLPTPGFLDY